MTGGPGEIRQALFISDVHLLPEGAPGAEALSARFAGFLDDAAARAERGKLDALYVLGDFFNYWYEPGGKVPRGFERDCRELSRAAGRGLRIVALPGNRDFLLGAGFKRLTGAEVAPDGLVLSLGGMRVEILHGDALALADRRYQFWKKFARGSGFRRFAGGIPSWAAEGVARLLRTGSELEKRTKSRASMRLCDEAIRRRVGAGADVVMVGHAHEPGERIVESATRRGRVITLGSWESGRGAHAEWDGERLRLVE